LRDNRKKDDKDDEKKEDETKIEKRDNKDKQEESFNDKMNRLNTFDDFSTTFELKEKPLRRIPLGRQSNINSNYCCNGRRK
jgi:hypothetical protein